MSSASDPQPPTSGRGLRILAVTNLWPEDGSFRGVFVEEQVTALRKLGHQVDVEVVAQSRGKKDYLLAIPRVRRRARAGRYDVVHIHYGMASLAGRFVGRTPRVLSLYGSDVNEPRERRITALGLGGVRRRIYVSRRMVETAGDPAGVVIPNGVDFSAFAPGCRALARRRYGLEPHEKAVLFGGLPANQVKGHDVFTDVLAALRERGLPVRELVLTEPGQSTADLAMKYDAADVLLFTSRKGFEGSPTVVKEATAMGLPVVSTDVGDVKEMLAEVTPSAVADFPEPWGTRGARAELVATLADRVAEVLEVAATRPDGRSDGRSRNAWLDSPRIAERIVEVYRSTLGPSR